MMGQSVCRLTTTSAVYFTTLSLHSVAQSIKDGALIPAWDDNDARCYLNPAAIRTVQEESDLAQGGDRSSAFVYVDFMAQVKLDRADVDEASGDLAQAVQNRIGHTGALVIDIEGGNPMTDQDTVRAVRGPDGLFRVEGTDRLFSGEILHAESREAFIGRERNVCPECGREDEE